MSENNLVDLLYKIRNNNSYFDVRKKLKLYPDGSFDNSKRWYPNDNEKCNCCDSIRNPSRRFPRSFLAHCRTRKHISLLIQKLSSEEKEELKTKISKIITELL